MTYAAKHHAEAEEMEPVGSLPFCRPSVLAIAPDYPKLRAGNRPVRVRTPAGDPAWLITRHDQVQTLLHDGRIGRAHRDPERAARYSHDAILGGPLGDFDTEPAVHTRKRRLLAGLFSRKRLDAMSGPIDTILDELLDAVAAAPQPVDLHRALALPMAMRVLCHFLGVPYTDHARIQHWMDDAGNMADRARAGAAFGELLEYVRGLIAEKQSTPGQDALSDLVAFRNPERGVLSTDELLPLTVALLFGGYETTVPRIEFGILFLLSHPGELAALRADPSLAPHAVEEILRVAAPSTGVVPRYAREDITLDGARISAGELVLLGHEQANQDPDVFPDPARFSVRRDAKQHLTFGYGSHSCLGAGLARMQLTAVLSTIFERFPALRLAVDADELRIRETALSGGLAELPVRWDGSDVESADLVK